MCFCVKKEGEQSQIPSPLPSLLHVALTLGIKKERRLHGERHLLRKIGMIPTKCLMDGNVVDLLDGAAGLFNSQGLCSQGMSVLFF